MPVHHELDVGTLRRFFARHQDTSLSKSCILTSTRIDHDQTPGRRPHGLQIHRFPDAGVPGSPHRRDIGAVAEDAAVHGA